MYYAIRYGYVQVGVAHKELGEKQADFFVLACVDFVGNYDDFCKVVVKEKEYEKWLSNNIRACTIYTVG